MKRTASRPVTAIFPITIETPYGRVVLAYRVHEGKVYGRPFLANWDPLALTSGAADFWDSLDLDGTIAEMWWAALPALKRAELEADCVFSTAK